MAGRKTPREGMKQPRIRLTLHLTRSEIEELEERAAADLRPIRQYVAMLILQPSRSARRGGTDASAGDKRKAYDVAVPLTIPRATKSVIDASVGLKRKGSTQCDFSHDAQELDAASPPPPTC